MREVTIYAHDQWPEVVSQPATIESGRPAQKYTERQRLRVRVLIGDRIDDAVSCDAVAAGQQYASGYVMALLSNDLVDIGTFHDLQRFISTAANSRLAALRGAPLTAPAGSPPKQYTPAAGPAVASLCGGS